MGTRVRPLVWDDPACPGKTKPVNHSYFASALEPGGYNYWAHVPCPSPGDLPNPGIEPKSPALQVDSLPSEPPGKRSDTESEKNIPMG